MRAVDRLWERMLAAETRRLRTETAWDAGRPSERRRPWVWLRDRWRALRDVRICDDGALP